VFLTSLHCTFMLPTQRGCLNSRLGLLRSSVEEAQDLY